MITVVTAPPFLHVQDAGRFGYRASGVPPSGAMDQRTFYALNALLGNAAKTAMLEWAIAGGTLRFEQPTTIALGGASVAATVNGERVQSGIPILLTAGSELRVERFLRGRFLYVAVAGGITVPVVLGSRSTNLRAGFGGFEGRRLKRGDVIPTGEATRIPHSDPSPILTATHALDAPARIRVLKGPQAAWFGESAWDTFLHTIYSVSHASDRMGYRLEGTALPSVAPAAFPSEPVCVGAIQVPADGAPIVLMNDGPTMGGYPKMAVIVSEDLSNFAQCMPGDAVRFELSSH